MEAEQRPGASNGEVIRVKAEGMKGSHATRMSEGEFSTRIKEGYFWSIAGGWTCTKRSEKPQLDHLRSRRGKL